MSKSAAKRFQISLEREFLHVKTHPPWSGFRVRSYPEGAVTETIRVPVTTLDDSLPDHYAPDFIKIDVEGAEEEVIVGGIHTISQHKPFVLFEHGRGAADYYGTKPGDIFDLLSGEAGLRIFDIAGNGPYSRDRFDEMFELNYYWNFLAHE